MNNIHLRANAPTLPSVVTGPETNSLMKLFLFLNESMLKVSRGFHLSFIYKQVSEQNIKSQRSP